MSSSGSNTVAGANGLEIASLASALARSGDHAGHGLIAASAIGQEAVIALNTAFMTDGAVIRTEEERLTMTREIGINAGRGVTVHRGAELSEGVGLQGSK